MEKNPIDLVQNEAKIMKLFYLKGGDLERFLMLT